MRFRIDTERGDGRPEEKVTERSSPVIADGHGVAESDPLPQAG